MSHPESATRTEVLSQPDCWEQAIALAATADGLPRSGERVAVVGCGTSAFLARSYASLRRSIGEQTDGWAASEFPGDRRYDRVVAISRSGTTTEVLGLLRRMGELDPRPRITAVTTDPETPIVDLVDDLVVLDFAAEESVVQTRSMTSALMLLRAGLNLDVGWVPDQLRGVLDAYVPGGVALADEWTYLGRGWTIGLAEEAALKLREATQSWTESYSAMEYRHGPISIAQPGRVVWCFGPPPLGLADDVRATGATFVDDNLDPAVDLVRVHLLSLTVAAARGLDPDRPRHLSRSIILDG